MSLQTFVLSDQSASLPIGPLVEKATRGGVEIRNPDGKTIAFVLTPDDQESWCYAEAVMDFLQHRDEIAEAANRRSGVTTDELLSHARREGKTHDLSTALETIKELVHEKLDELGAQGNRFNESDEKRMPPKAKAG